MTGSLLLVIVIFMYAALRIIDSFNLVQSVTGPTHERGHTLDLVLSYGLPVFNLEICDAFFL